MKASSSLFALSVVIFLSGTLPAADTNAPPRVAQVEACLTPPVLVKGDPPACQALTKRMTELHVPGVSIAVIHDGVLEWTRG